MILTFKVEMAQIHNKYFDILMFNSLLHLQNNVKSICITKKKLCHYECLRYTLIESEVH